MTSKFSKFIHQFLGEMNVQTPIQFATYINHSDMIRTSRGVPLGGRWVDCTGPLSRKAVGGPDNNIEALNITLRETLRLKSMYCHGIRQVYVIGGVFHYL